MIYMCVAVGRWEVVAAHHRVHDYACCHLQADCLESGNSSGPLRSITSMENLYLYLYHTYTLPHNMAASDTTTDRVKLSDVIAHYAYK